mgnify:CR=1 FL=1
MTLSFETNEQSADFSREALTMCSNLCLAQAQELHVIHNQENPELLSSIYAQISIFYQKAFEANQ